jgi:hypothetical protein
MALCRRPLSQTATSRWAKDAATHPTLPTEATFLKAMTRFSVQAGDSNGEADDALIRHGERRSPAHDRGTLDPDLGELTLKLLDGAGFERANVECLARRAGRARQPNDHETRIERRCRHERVHTRRCELNRSPADREAGVAERQELCDAFGRHTQSHG